MKVFDKYIIKTREIYEKSDVKKVHETGKTWDIQNKNIFLMDRDTAIELGGYPKESINLIIPTALDLQELSGLPDGIYCIGDADLLNRQKHISFGKIVLLETEELEEDAIYDFTQQELLTDSRIYMKDVMLRQSPTHYNINLRVGTRAMKDGFDLSVMGKSIYQAFHGMEHVKSVVVILLMGDTDLYRPLLEVAETVKELTISLNHIFNGIDMDCANCATVELCNEVKGAIQANPKGTRL